MVGTHQGCQDPESCGMHEHGYHEPEVPRVATVTAEWRTWSNKYRNARYYSTRRHDTNSQSVGHNALPSGGSRCHADDFLHDRTSCVGMRTNAYQSVQRFRLNLRPRKYHGNVSRSQTAAHIKIGASLTSYCERRQVRGSKESRQVQAGVMRQVGPPALLANSQVEYALDQEEQFWPP
jgi:hypothetical protein